MQEKTYITLKEAEKLTPYDSNYLGLLVRKKRLRAIKKDGKWMVTREDVLEYLERVSDKAEVQHEIIEEKITEKEKANRLTWRYVAILILLVGLMIGGFLIFRNSEKSKQINGIKGSYQIEQNDDGSLNIYVDTNQKVRSINVVPKE